METLSVNTALFSALGFAFLILGIAKTSGAQTFAEMEKDCKQLDGVYGRFSDETYWVFGQAANGTLSEALEVYLQVYDKVKTINDVSLKQAEQAVADFKKKYGKYGDNSEGLSRRFTEIRDSDKSIDHSGSPQPVPSPAYDALKDNIQQYKTNILEEGNKIALTASYTLDMIEYREDPKEVSDMLMTMATALNLAKKFNPQCAQATELLAKLDGIRKTKLKQIEDARKSARMPKNHPEFKGNAAEVIKKALEFLNEKNKGGKQNYFTGTIAHPWVERVDVFGNTIDYTIRLFIGYQTQGEPANVVHVYQAVLFTCGKKPEASFCTSGSVLGWEFTMLKENLGK